MIEYSLRFNVKEGQEDSFLEFLADTKESLQTYDREGWQYKGLYCNVYDLGSQPRYEIRFQLETFAALDSPWGMTSRVTAMQFIKYMADLPIPEARLQKPIDEITMIKAW